MRVACELRNLRDPAGSVIVLRITFRLSVLVRGHPRRGTARTIGAFLHARVRQAHRLPRHRYRLNDLDKVQRVDDADAATGDAALDSLRVQQIRRHPGLVVDEPGPQVTCRVIGITPVAGNLPGRGEGRHVQAQPDQRVSMGDEVVGIRHPVPLDVRSVGIGRVRPPVVPFGEVGVAAAGAARIRRGSDRLRRLTKVLIGRAKDSRSFDRPKIQVLASRNARQDQAGRSSEKRPSCYASLVHASGVLDNAGDNSQLPTPNSQNYLSRPTLNSLGVGELEVGS